MLNIYLFDECVYNNKKETGCPQAESCLATAWCLPPSEDCVQWPHSAKLSMTEDWRKVYAKLTGSDHITEAQKSPVNGWLQAMFGHWSLVRPDSYRSDHNHPAHCQHEAPDLISGRNDAPFSCLTVPSCICIVTLGVMIRSCELYSGQLNIQIHTTYTELPKINGHTRLCVDIKTLPSSNSRPRSS